MPRIKLLVYLPLPPGSGWRGEGIAQTIESIAPMLSTHIALEILTTAEIRDQMSPELQARCTFICLQIGSPDRATEWTAAQAAQICTESTSYFVTRVAEPTINAIKKLFATVIYIIQLKLFITLLNRKLIKRDIDAVWIPSPGIALSEAIRRPTILSFWDPFVFEYRSFGGVSDAFYAKMMKLCRHASLVLTQSRCNSEFLTNVLDTPQSLVRVVPNGSPSYTKRTQVSELNSIESNLHAWSKPVYVGRNKTAIAAALVKDNINKSILWRLLEKKSFGSIKVALISTQDRPYKGIELFLKVVEFYNQHYELPLHCIFTADLQRLLKNKYAHMTDQVYEITRVSNRQHALLYEIADVAVHPSAVEGGWGAYPQFEAESLGKPSLVHRGRHVEEMCLENKLTTAEKELISADFNNIPSTSAQLYQLLTDAAYAKENVKCIRKCRRSWADAAKEYSDAILATVDV